MQPAESMDRSSPYELKPATRDLHPSECQTEYLGDGSPRTLSFESRSHMRYRTDAGLARFAHSRKHDNKCVTPLRCRVLRNDCTFNGVFETGTSMPQPEQYLLPLQRKQAPDDRLQIS